MFSCSGRSVVICGRRLYTWDSRRTPAISPPFPATQEKSWCSCSRFSRDRTLKVARALLQEKAQDVKSDDQGIPCGECHRMSPSRSTCKASKTRSRHSHQAVGSAELGEDRGCVEPCPFLRSCERFLDVMCRPCQTKSDLRYHRRSEQFHFCKTVCNLLIFAGGWSSIWTFSGYCGRMLLV